jgi:methyl-accepting chemotaxis protein
MRLENITVGKKLIGGFIIVALLSALVGIFATVKMANINDAASRMYQTELMGVSHVKEANIQLFDFARLWRSALLTPNKQERIDLLERARTSLVAMNNELEESKKLFYTEEGHKLFAKLEAAQKEWEANSLKALAMIPNENVAQPSAEFEALLKVLGPQIILVDNLLTELSNRKADNAKQASQDIGALFKSSRNTMLFIAALGLLIGGALGYFIARGIVGRLSHAVGISNKLAVGDSNCKVTVEGTDEVGQLLASMSTMLESIKEGLKAAEFNAQVKQALDSASTNVMIANNDRKIIYLNKSVETMLRVAEADIRAVLPHFAVDKLLDSNMDIFHKNPAHQMKLLETLTAAFTSNIVVGKRHFRLVANPIFSKDGSRLGSVVEWLDRTQEVAVEGEVSGVVQAAGAGNFKARIPLEGKTGFFLTLAEGLNALMQTSDVGLGEVNRVLGAIAKGDLTEKITADYSGTFGDLKDYCNSTTDSLSDIIGEIRSAAETIFTASSEIAQGNSDLSSRTEQQAANLEETASSMEELTSTVKLNADNAKQANVLAEQASTVASDGGMLIQQVVVTMSSINESSQKIADIIGVIDGIAFQTNILALNAAVEAARAGDQGRGFAVVASEVRTLAQRSANAAKDIKALISDSVKKIENGNSLVSKSGDTMKEIVTAIKRVNDIMAEIAAASVEQSSGIEEVSTAVSQMDEMTQQNAALVEEAAAAAESLQSQADQLTQRVSQFRLNNDSSHRAHQANSRLSSSGAKPAAKSLIPAKKLVPPKSQDDEWESF